MDIHLSADVEAGSAIVLDPLMTSDKDATIFQTAAGGDGGLAVTPGAAAAGAVFATGAPIAWGGLGGGGDPSLDSLTASETPATVTVTPHAFAAPGSANVGSSAGAWDGEMAWNEDTEDPIWEIAAEAATTDEMLLVARIYLDSVNDRWVLSVYCFHDIDPVDVWVGFKTTGDTPVGTYARDHGSDTTSALVVA